MATKKNVLDFSTVLASSVHDMKNSVGMLLSSVETILDESPPQSPEQAKHFQTLHYEASRINGELVRLLTLYRMDGGFLPVSVDEHFVIDMLEDQIARNHILIESSGLQLAVKCDPDLVWYFDMDLIGGVVQNILVNCIRYTKNKINIKAFVEENTLSICIEDNGPGYPEDMLEDPTHRIEQAEVSEGATHLGLFFAQKIAQLHTQDSRVGEISLGNGGELGGGIFRLNLP